MLLLSLEVGYDVQQSRCHGRGFRAKCLGMAMFPYQKERRGKTRLERDTLDEDGVSLLRRKQRLPWVESALSRVLRYSDPR